MSALKFFQQVLFPKGIRLHSQEHEKTDVVPLTAAQLIAMGTTPVSIIPAPGAGKAILVDAIMIEAVRTSTAFTGGGAIAFQYHTTTTSIPHSGSVPASFLTGAAGTVMNLLGPATGANGTVVPANEGIDITNATAPFATGTGTAYVYIRYRVIILN